MSIHRKLVICDDCGTTKTVLLGNGTEQKRRIVQMMFHWLTYHKANDVILDYCPTCAKKVRERIAPKGETE